MSRTRSDTVGSLVRHDEYLAMMLRHDPEADAWSWRCSCGEDGARWWSLRWQVAAAWLDHLERAHPEVAEP